MPDYSKSLETIEKKIIELLAAENHEMYLLSLIKKAQEAGISESKTTLRDAIMIALGKEKTTVETRPPKQLVVRLSDKK
jgi:hypothetical protein